jgi:dGTPase
MNNAQHWHSRRSEVSNSRPNDHRSPFERDRARILHSAAFRRLQAKTQIQSVGLNDFYRTRLTHSLEVSQIGTGLLSQLKIKSPELYQQLGLDDQLMESLCLAHDIGHPPFGHGGETALNFMMREHGSFEGNGQTLRILSVIEPYTESFGMNLTRRTLLGLLKYPNTIGQLQKRNKLKVDDYKKIKASDWTPAKGIFDDDKLILDWILAPLGQSERKLFQSFNLASSPDQHNKTLYKSVDASIMELADDIAYGVHDLEDAIVVGNIPRDLWFEQAIPQFNQITDRNTSELIKQISEKLFSRHHHIRKEAIGQLVNTLITSVEFVQTSEQFDTLLLRHNCRLPDAQFKVLDILKKFVYQYVICKPQIQQVGFKGQKIVMELFEAFASDPLRLLPYNTQNRWRKARDRGDDPHRVVCDYVSGMTDEYAKRMYHEMLSA